MKPPVLFLDIDGVLAPQGRINPWVVDAEAMAQLQRIVETTGAKLVLASSWPRGAAEELLAAHGLVLTDCLGEARLTYRGRPREIRKYIRRHAVKRWVWLDDDVHPESAPVKGIEQPKDPRARIRYPYPLDRERHLQPDWRIRWTGEILGQGLDAAMADEAIRLLSAPLSLHLHVQQLARAIRREEADIARRFPIRPGQCCPTCVYGCAFTAAADRLERMEAELQRLEAKQ